MATPLPSGVFQAQMKNGSIYYRSSITYRMKHISLGSFSDMDAAHTCYLEASQTLNSNDYSIDDYEDLPFSCLSLEKYVSLCNFRDNGMYFKNPIYLYSNYFKYFYSKDIVFTFDVDDLFFYSKHKIMKRGGHLFISDYGMQVNILSRYGIKNHAVNGKDYEFVNQDSTDFRYKNIRIINRYYGVFQENKNTGIKYVTKIHLNGDYIIGRYVNEIDAAIAYNKAVDYANNQGCTIEFCKNYIENLSSIEYASRYQSIKLSKKFMEYFQ